MSQLLTTCFLPLCILLSLSSCIDEIPEKVIHTTDTLIYGTIDRVLIIGNSITIARPLPEEGWYGNWGMAASDSSRDYVHVLMDSIWKYNPSVEFKVTGTGVVFENEFLEYDMDSVYSEFRAFRPEFIIIRVGENVNDSLAGAVDFESYFVEFVDYFRTNERVPVICASSFWERVNTTQRMKAACEKNNYLHLELHDLYQNLENVAFADFESISVGSHPNDLGMRRIANRIWNKAKPFFQ